MVTTVGGCDSTVLLELTVFEVDTTIAVSSENPLTLEANANSATFQWYDCNLNQNIEGATAADFVPSASGSFAVIVTQNGCVDTSACYSAIVSSTLSNIFDFSVNVFPNPANDVVHIQLGKWSESILVELIDVTGSVQLSQVVQNSKDFSIPVQQLPNGIYMVNLSIDGKTGFLKLLKQ